MPLVDYLGKQKINKAEYQDIQYLKEADLQKMLDEALSNEDYELCSRIQEVINSKSNKS